jgi:hypothetical protein
MSLAASFLGTVVAAGTAAAGPSAPSWWQVIGGSVAVFALLVLFLRLLARWQGGPRARQAALLAVLPLGPRREIQVVRLRDQVHYIYRHESALLALDRQAYADYAAAPIAPEWGRAGGLGGLWQRLGRRDAALRPDGERSGRSS